MGTQVPFACWAGQVVLWAVIFLVARVVQIELWALARCLANGPGEVSFRSSHADAGHWVKTVCTCAGHRAENFAHW